ncbi:Patched family protein, partial [Aphelenchoides avenae]
MKIQHPTHLFERGFFWLGLRIGRHPVRVIVGTLAITLLMALGMIRFEEVNNVRTEYSPMNSPSKLEYAVAKMFLKQNGTMDPCYVMTHARDGGDLLRDEYRWLIYNLTKALQTEVVVEKHGRRYSFKDLCEPYCELNTAFLAFLKLYDPKNPATYSYPSIELFGTMAFIGNNVYGISLKPNSSELTSFTTAVMPFYLVAAYEDTDAVIAWQHAAIELFEQPEYSVLLK